MASNEFLWKPVADGGRPAVALIPNKYNGLVASVTLVGPNGSPIERGNFTGAEHNGARGHYRFSRQGASYGPNVSVVVTLDSGEQVSYGLPHGGYRMRGNSPGQLRHDAGGPGDQSGGVSGGSPIPGADVFDVNGVPIALPGTLPFDVQFDPISAEEALDAGDERAEQNREDFAENFGITRDLSLEALDTELTGLEDFVPQAAELIRDQTRLDNEFTREQVGVFDEFNRERIGVGNEFNRTEISDANQFNIAERQARIEEAFPGVTQILNESVERSRAFAEGRLPDEIQDRVLERTAENRAADIGTAGGFGTRSAVTNNLLDIVPLEQRLQIQQQGEQQLSNALNQFDQFLIPDIREQDPQLFQVDQVSPQISQVGAQISAVPSTDAGTIQREQAQLLNQETLISAQDAAQLQFNEQQFNSEGQLQVDLARLNFLQNQNNAAAAAVNTGFQIAADQAAFGAALDAREDADRQGAIGQIIGAAGSVIGGILGGGGGGIGGAIGSAIGSLFGRGAGGALAGGAAATGAAIGGQAVVGTGVTASGAPGLLLADGSIVATEAAIPELASSVSGFGVPVIFASAIAAGGTAAYNAIENLLDGDVTQEDITRLAGFLGGPTNAVTQGLNSILGEPINERDLNNAIALSNPLTAPLAVLDIFGFDIGDAFGSGKSEEQQFRDGLRDAGEAAGFLTVEGGNHQIRLADGSNYNIGSEDDINNFGVNVDGQEVRKAYDVDWSDPRAGQSVGWANPLSMVLYRNKEGQKMLAHLVNASWSNNTDLGTTKANMRQFAANAGISYQQGLDILNALNEDGQIVPEEFEAYKNGWFDLMVN